MTLTVAVGGPTELGRHLLAQNLRDEAMAVVAVVAAAEELHAACRAAPPQAAVIELVGADASYQPVITALLGLGTRTIVVARAAEPSHLTAALMAGASGLVFFDRCSRAELADAVQSATRGEAALHPLVAAAVLDQWRELQRPAAPVLTAREQDVLEAIVEGLTMKEIAIQLQIALKTVESHQNRLFSKLGARNRAQAVLVAHARGLADLPASGLDAGRASGGV